MNQKDHFKAAVLSLKAKDRDFEPLALEIFHYQAEKNQIYKAFLKNLNIKPSKITRLEKIPCLPISFFKTQKVISDPFEIQHTFESSGTTGVFHSKHHVADLPFYEYLSLKTFEHNYGSITDYHILALLPNYLEKGNSSLVYMVENFIYRSLSKESGFYLKNTKALSKQLNKLLAIQDKPRKVLLLGVTFALLDFAELGLAIQNHNEQLIVMETGGMKGRKKEILRSEVHEVLKNALNVKTIHSEYGMTELLSQAYASQDGWFRNSATLRILIREINDPFSYLPSFSVGNKSIPRPRHKKTGGINIIDLANIDSCCFIETQDLACYSEDYNSFQILGRFDNSDIRGCNLMALT